ncbi:hypothetical protein BGZ80_004963 [Entomortierella chlamydospora]|uniref:Uncharacterized protein n=1 Tax=Entomortierella chlamydospora TaxID=101097 RepID=A0A9P6T299_9FUNG|nr:hypothetical protein BGZ80_004963 [Entomortierella chlamydospora]
MELEQEPRESQQEQVFEKFEAYDFENDATFQTGLKSIVSNNKTKSEKEQHDAIQNAKFFYFARFVQPFDYNQYKAWLAKKSTTSTSVGSAEPASESQSSVTATEEPQSSLNPDTSTPAADPSYPKSFQEICDLIAAGKPIPGIRQIPNNLADGTPSEAKLAPKLKPWEQKKAAAAAASTTTTAEAAAPSESIQESV